MATALRKVIFEAPKGDAQAAYRILSVMRRNYPWLDRKKICYKNYMICFSVLHLVNDYKEAISDTIELVTADRDKNESLDAVSDTIRLGKAERKKK